MLQSAKILKIVSNEFTFDRNTNIKPPWSGTGETTQINNELFFCIENHHVSKENQTAKDVQKEILKREVEVNNSRTAKRIVSLEAELLKQEVS